MLYTAVGWESKIFLSTIFWFSLKKTPSSNPSFARAPGAFARSLRRAGAKQAAPTASIHVRAQGKSKRQRAALELPASSCKESSLPALIASIRQ